MQVDHGVPVDVEEVPHADYVGTPEKDNRIAVRMRRGFVVQDHSFSIEEELLFFR
jgi:hypothetical protein